MVAGFELTSTARSEVAYSVEEALSIADRLGYPVVLRPAYTMSGAMFWD